jgi:phosphatidylglycerol:prolipoprotein diacylglycerol transferase
MFIYPDINPIAFHVGAFAVHWYGLMYLLAISIAWGLAQWRGRCSDGQWNGEQISELILYMAMGVILGGRMGFVLFYSFSGFLADPMMLFRVWEGGMSFHGGLLGVMLAMWLYALRYRKSLLVVADFVAPLVPIGLGLGRMGNFINGELWGRVTTMPWGMVFPHVDNLARHPSQLYEFMLEGVCLFILLWWYSAKQRPPGKVASLFLIGYGIVRFSVEFFRMPDAQLGFLAWHWLTMGQVLSIPMILLGFFIWRKKYE